MSKEKLRFITISIVIILSAFAIISLALDGKWSEVVTALLGAAGFLLTYEMTKSKGESDDTKL